MTSFNYRAQRGLAVIAPRVPARIIVAACDAIGFFSRVVARHSRRRVANNLDVVQPLTGRHRRRRTDRAVANYARYWCEAFRLPACSPDEVRDGITVHGWEYVEHSLARGQGTILALPHLGGWEWAGRWLALRGVEVVAVAERLDDDDVFGLHVGLRENVGIGVLALGPDTSREALAVLRRNGVLCLLSDRDLTGDGVPVSFFGHDTTIPGGAATLALRTGASVLPTAVFTTGSGLGHLGLVRPPLDTSRSQGGLRTDVARITAHLTRELEFLIRSAPEQWHMFQQRFMTHAG